MSKEIILIFFVLLIIITGLVVALISSEKKRDRLQEQLTHIADFLLDRYIINERDKEIDGDSD